MADIVDMAAEIEGEHLAASLAQARVSIPVGVPGECDNCGDDFPRLVGGLCGYCRDGRRPMLTSAPAPAEPLHHPSADEAPTLPPSPSQEIQTMAATAALKSRAITFPADGDLLRAIEQRAEAESIGLGRAAMDLAMRGLAAINEPPADPAPVPPAVEDVHLDALLGEVRRRFEHAGDRSAELAAITRADEAEGKLARLREALAA